MTVRCRDDGTYDTSGKGEDHAQAERSGNSRSDAVDPAVERFRARGLVSPGLRIGDLHVVHMRAAFGAAAWVYQLGGGAGHRSAQGIRFRRIRPIQCGAHGGGLVTDRRAPLLTARFALKGTRPHAS